MAGRVLMATVKGDVHDIGKNIVGVVLQCNNYEVIDLGVMVPADRILDEAVARKVDIVGLSGLITPSLDEMVFVAGEMQRRGFTIPLLIGGATTSRTHTAVKIEPSYSAGSTTYVLDASRAVGVVSGLLSADNKAGAEAATREEYVKIREQFTRAQAAKVRTPLAQARANPFRIDWNTGLPLAPNLIGVKTFAPWDLGDLRRFIDWSPFFQAWELVGRFPAILEDDVVGEVARSLYADATAMLDKIVAERWFEARGVAGLWPANSDGDDVIVWTDETRTVERARFHTLRQQMAKAEGRANVALADFIAPVGQGDDHIGGFAVTAGHGEAAIAAKFKAAGDDYNAIIGAALADRLAEAFAEALALQGAHRTVGLRREGRLRHRPHPGRRLPGHPSRAGLSRPARPHRKGDPVRPVGRHRRDRHRTHRVLRHDARRPRSPASTSPTPPRTISAWARSSGIRSRTMRGGKGWELKTGERWLGPLLNYEPAR